MDRDKPLQYLLRFPHINILAYDCIGDLFYNTEGALFDVALVEINKQYVIITMTTHVPLFADTGFDAICNDFEYEMLSKEESVSTFLDHYQRGRINILSGQIIETCRNLRFLSPAALANFFWTPTFFDSKNISG